MRLFPAKIVPTIAFLLAFVLSVARGAESVRDPFAPWAPVDSDLPADPGLIDGRLANGVRYLLLPNPEPRDHVSLRLVVAAGSLHENDDESGLAHFVEHMAFRGTRDFPHGKMAETLQRLGVAFGPDSTAFTSFDHTIYHLELPDAKPATLQVALHALREYAAGVTFDPQLIERERGVVLSEMATRDTPFARGGEYQLRLLWPNSREVRRKVIGDRASLSRFTREQFQAFYDAWYRPERLALIAVGAIDPAALQRQLQAEFGGLTARAPARPEPAGVPAAEAAGPDVRLFTDPATVGLWLGFLHPIAAPRMRDTHAERVRRTQRALAFAMLQLRLRKLASEPNASFVGPVAMVDTSITGWETASVGVNGRILDWRDAAVRLETEHRRAVQYGFTGAELREARQIFTAQLEDATRTAATRQSSWLAQLLLGTLLHGRNFVRPETLQHDLAGEIATTQLSDCLREFRAAWTTGAPTVFIAANSAFLVTRDEIARALNDSRQQPVDRPPDVAPASFAYTDFGPAGKLIQDQYLADLDVRLTEFENHVKFNFKPTTFTANMVEVRVRVGDGKLSQLLSRPGIDLLANTALAAGGVGRHTQRELNEILAGRTARLGFGVDTDAFVFSGTSSRDDLDILLRIITAYLTDASYRPEALRDAMAGFGGLLAELAASPGAPLRINALRDLYGGDNRFGIATYDELTARDLGELRAWLEPQFNHGPIELSIVGDVSWDAARTAVSATLGALPSRDPVRERATAVPVVRAAARTNVQGYPIPPTMKQVALAWFWPVPQIADIRQERRCHLLAAVVAERMRVKLREELGATYSPLVGFSALDGFPTVNYFAFYAEVDPRLARQAIELIDRETGDLSKRGPTADEFERVKQPYLRSMNDDLRTNSYWGGTVLDDAQQRPSRIEAARNRAADITAIDRKELTALAHDYLTPKNAWRYCTVPMADPSRAKQ